MRRQVYVLYQKGFEPSSRHLVSLGMQITFYDIVKLKLNKFELGKDLLSNLLDNDKNLVYRYNWGHDEKNIVIKEVANLTEILARVKLGSIPDKYIDQQCEYEGKPDIASFIIKTDEGIDMFERFLINPEVFPTLLG